MPNVYLRTTTAEVLNRVSPVKTLRVVETQKVLLTRNEQGPAGASWPEPFALAARFGEIAGDPTAKALARQNLDLQDIDCGTFN